jgi:hypothetical protein
MADVFKRTELQWGGAFAADRGIITPAAGLTGVLMQNLQLQYSQNITKIYELGNVGQKISVYMIGGRSQGQMTIAHIVGPKLVLKAFYDKFSDVCEAENNHIEIKLTRAQCGPGGGSKTVKYKCKWCVLVQIGVSVSAQDLVINENSTLQFSNMEFNEN